MNEDATTAAVPPEIARGRTEGISTTPMPSQVSEALFRVADIRTLRLATSLHETSVGDYLTHQIARDPSDLRRHIQRIGLFVGRGADYGPHAYGALLDLFFALGEKGIALRLRMLNTVRPVLTQEQYRALEDGLERGLSPLDRLPPTSESVLGKGIRGTTRLVAIRDCSSSGRSVQ